ncbi:EID1-like F-box protein 3 [Chenopodium quinoa]|uniref:EID1-like F-box protein 3 n=1 Tax=Chenopodium quinoa TaxID=63459 RepID=UPI000B781C10|nr:EID1-like F-box protein 3 [Chenopodium quinoa]
MQPFFPPTQDMNLANKRANTGPTGHESDSEPVAPESRILNEEILLLVFGYIKWDLKTVCATARVSRKFRAVAKRILWRAMCSYRAPRMVAGLSHGLPGSRIGGGWHALAKLMFFCCGCQPTSTLKLKVSLPGHFVKEARFSKTSGLSFLTKRCHGDLLYVSDPCEHPMGEGEDDLGIYRGVFRGFMRSKTRACLIGRQVQLEEQVRCPYCGARVWSMTSAKLVPKTAAKRLGTHQGGLEYFVCINGHMYGACCLVPLTTDDDGLDDDDDDYEDDDDQIDDGVDHHNSHNGCE